MASWSVNMGTGELDKLVGLLKGVGAEAFIKALAASVYAEATTIMVESKRQVPLRDGPLRASGTVNEPIVEGSNWSVVLGYGGAASAYALIQHENLLFRHASGRKAKYLEDPVQERVRVMDKALAWRVQNYFEKGSL